MKSNLPRRSVSLTSGPDSNQARLSLLGKDLPYADNSDNSIYEAPRLPNESIFAYHNLKIYNPPIPSTPFPNIFQFIWNVITSAIYLLLFFLILPVFLLFFIIFGIFRLCIKFFYSSNIFSLLPISRVFASNSSQNILFLVIKGTCDHQLVRRSIFNVINTGKFYKLRKCLSTKMGYLTLDYCRPGVDIRNHIKLFSNGNISVTKTQIISYLEETYESVFEIGGAKPCPQWETLIVPTYYEEGRSGDHYAIIFRCHGAILDWNGIRELFSFYLGKTRGGNHQEFSVHSPLDGPEGFQKFLVELKALCKLLYKGPVKLMRKLFERDGSGMFEELQRINGDEVSLGASIKMRMETWEEIQMRTGTGNLCGVGSCARVSVRNLLLGQEMDLKGDCETVRLTGGGVDSYKVGYGRFRSCHERLYATNFKVGRNRSGLMAERRFNKVFIWMASVFPLKIAGWLNGIILKGDIALEIWQGPEEPIEMWEGDKVKEVYGWSGVGEKGNKDFKLTVTTYCGEVRVCVVGRLGKLSSGISGGQQVANEFGEEYEQLATAVAVHPNLIYEDAKPYATETDGRID